MTETFEEKLSRWKEYSDVHAQESGMRGKNCVWLHTNSLEHGKKLLATKILTEEDANSDSGVYSINYKLRNTFVELSELGFSCNFHVVRENGTEYDIEFVPSRFTETQMHKRVDPEENFYLVSP